MISPGSAFKGYRGKVAHIADSESEWLPRVASLCGQWHPRSGKFAALEDPARAACQKCAKAETVHHPRTYINPFSADARDSP